MYTYTTPTITCKLTGLEFSQVELVRIAIKGRTAKLIKILTPSDFDIETGETAILLTQEETAALGQGQIEIQGRIKYQDGTVQPTNKIKKTMNDVLDKVVI